ncbi:MAG: adenosylmethionine decarboxylase [Dehalococcoidia bacterium]|nr:adenosylmethionine decarboxylase [Dehalococcoidia bacterium]
MNALGQHIILDLKDCNRQILNDLPRLQQTLLEAAESTGATIIGKTFHQFSPYGVTGVIAISESHLSIHTWPEFGYAAVDIFTCGENFNARAAAELIIEALQSRSPTLMVIQRGLGVSVASPVA